MPSSRLENPQLQERLMKIIDDLKKDVDALRPERGETTPATLTLLDAMLYAAVEHVQTRVCCPESEIVASETQMKRVLEMLAKKVEIRVRHPELKDISEQYLCIAQAAQKAATSLTLVSKEPLKQEVMAEIIARQKKGLGYC